MSSKGPEMVGGRYGSAWNGRKNIKIRRPIVAAAAAFTGLIWARPTVVRREIWPAQSSGGSVPPWSAPVERGGRNRLPRPKPVWPKSGSKRPSSGSTGFREFL